MVLPHPVASFYHNNDPNLGPTVQINGGDDIVEVNALIVSYAVFGNDGVSADETSIDEVLENLPVTLSVDAEIPEGWIEDNPRRTFRLYFAGDPELSGLIWTYRGIDDVDEERNLVYITFELTVHE